MPETTAAIAKLNELIRGIETAILTTVRPDGSLHSCPMASHAADEYGVLWFLSDNRSEKANAVRTSQRVNLAYADHAAQRYVSVSGYCELLRDHAVIKQLWQPNYGAWFAGGADDPNLILFKIDIQHAEYWDASQARMLPLGGFPGIV